MSNKIKLSDKRDLGDIPVMKIFLLFRLLCGNFINICNSKLINRLVKIYCMAVAILVGYVYFRQFNFVLNFYWNRLMFAYFEYIMNVIISWTFTEKYLYKYFAAVRTGDLIMGFKKTRLLPLYVYLIVVTNIFLRIFVSIIIYIFAPRIIWPTFIIHFCTLLSTDLSYVTVLIIFSILYSRMKLLRCFLEKSSIPITVTRDDDISIHVRNSRMSLYNYDHLLDNVLMLNKQLQCTLIICMAVNFPKCVTTTFVFITSFLLNEVTHYTLIHLVELLQFLITLCCPALVVDLAVYEVDQIKYILTKQLTRCSDESLRTELQAALQYITLRPFSYTIGRVVPCNINLPVSFLALVITYVIVLMQFSHFRV